jgi:hypothetical protein
MNVVEHPDRWSVIVDHLRLEGIQFDWAVTLVVGEGEERLDIRLEGSFTLGDGAGVRQALDPEGDPDLLSPVLRLLRRPLVRLDAFKDGHLELQMADGTTVIVAASEDYESWGIVGDRGFRIVSTSGNGLAVWIDRPE